MEHYQEIESQIQLLKASLEGCLSEEEQNKLDCWLARSDENRSLYKKLKDNRLLLDKLDFYEHADMCRDWKQIERKISVRRRRLWIRMLSYAAVFVGLFIVAGILVTMDREAEPEQLAQVLSCDTIVPGYRQAYIEFGTGEKIALGRENSGFIRQLGQGVVRESDEGLRMEKVDSLQAEADTYKLNKVVVPRGGEYRLQLADGTEVWLNSDSRLEFPVVFTGEERRVKLQGEAYFKVAPNKKMPFHVEVDGMEISVLGTSFNVQHYNDCMRTTLVEGVVEVSADGDVYRLSPGEEANVSDGRVTVEKVDVYERIAWTKGKFVFRDMRLEEVMDILQRWYDVEVFYQNKEVKDLHFTGNIQRHATINEVLKFLERIRLVSFSISGRTVIVTKNN